MVTSGQRSAGVVADCARHSEPDRGNGKAERQGKPILPHLSLLIPPGLSRRANPVFALRGRHGFQTAFAAYLTAPAAHLAHNLTSSLVIV
jgi:hypothetical protein